jgi:tetratricopeptide (TPR) repeat protein
LVVFRGLAREINKVKLNTPHTLTIACSVAIVVSTLSGNAFARGQSGGHGSSGMSHSGSRGMTSRNFVRRSPSNGVRRGNNFKMNRGSVLRRGGNSRSRFVGNRYRRYNLATRSLRRSNGAYWRKYTGWGSSGHSRRGYGWGWGSWYSPYAYGWCSYEPIPVVAYYNPYCDCAGKIVDGVDYSVPIADESSKTDDAEDTDAYAAAREAFAEGNMEAALNSISAALLQAPHNQEVHQFHSLVLFAMNSYCKSATVAHAVLEDGPGWTWDTLQTFYPSADVYTEELRRLEHYVSEHPSDANVRFLLGYHYLMLNHGDSAQRQLAQVVELEPKDKLVSNILTGLRSETPAQEAPEQEGAPINKVPERTAPALEAAPIDKVRRRTAPARKRAPVKIATSKEEETEDVTPEQTAPVQAQREQTDQAETVPVQTAKSDNVPPMLARPKSATAKAQPEEVDPDEKVPAETETAKAEPVDVEVAKVAPTKVDTAAPAKQLGPVVVPAKVETAKVATAKDDSEKYEPEGTEPEKTQVAKNAAAEPQKAKANSVATASDKKESDFDEEKEEDSPSNAKPVVNEELVAEVRNVPTSWNTPLTGTWKASPAKGVQIELTLRDDKTFNWKFTANGKPQNFTGKYKADAKSLVLTREDGELMEGTLNRDGEATFKFRMKEADADDPGLDFSR